MTNVRIINSVGDAPYPQVRSMLVKVQSPEQLRQIEIAAPQICGEDGETVLLYWAFRAEAQREIEADEEKLGAAMLTLEKESEKHQSKHVHPSEVPPLPKMGGMRLIKIPREKKGHGPVATSADKPTFSVGSRIKVQSDKDLKKTRCEAKERQSIFNPDSKISRLTHQLTTQSTQIEAAPRLRVQDHRNPAWKPHDPSIKPAAVFVPKRKRVELDKSSAQSQVVNMEEKERGLRALTTLSKARLPQYQHSHQAWDNPGSSNRPPPQARSQKRKRVVRQVFEGLFFNDRY
ncbi:hypothetical protein MMC22_003522 [Lobaria immixta]|nr:hypothetical protein [Lobaria immixta]